MSPKLNGPGAMLSILWIKPPPTLACELTAARPAASSARSCELPPSDVKLKLESNGVVGDLTVGNGGKALSCDTGNTGDTGRLGNGDVELRRNGTLKGDLGRLLCVVGDAVCAVFPAVGFGECLSECRKESTFYDTISLGIPRVRVEGLVTYM